MNSYGETSKNLSESSQDESEEESLSSKDSDSDDAQGSMKQDDDSDNLTEESQTTNGLHKTRKSCDSVSGKRSHNNKCSTDDQSCEESSNDSDTGETSSNVSKSAEASEEPSSASGSSEDSEDNFPNIKTVDKSKNCKPIAVKKYLKNSKTNKNSHASSPQPGSSHSFKKNVCSETEEDSPCSGISDESDQSTDESDMKHSSSEEDICSASDEESRSLNKSKAKFQSSDSLDDYFDSDSEKHFEAPQTVAKKAKNESSETSEESEDDSSDDESGKCDDSQINQSKRKANSRTPATKGKHEIQIKVETPRKIQVDQKTGFSHSNDDSSTNDDANEGSDDYDDMQRYSPRPKFVNKSLGSKLSNHSKLVKGNEKVNNGYQRKGFSKDSENKETSEEDSDISEISLVDEKQNKADISSEDTDSSEESSNEFRNKSGQKFKCGKENKCVIPYKEKQKGNKQNKKSSRQLQTKKSISSESDASENSATDDEEVKVIQKSRDERMKCNKHVCDREYKPSVAEPSVMSLKKRGLKKQSSSAIEAPIAAPKPPPPPPPPPPLEEPSRNHGNVNDKTKNAECKTIPIKSLMPNLCNEILKFKFKKSISNENVATTSSSLMKQVAKEENLVAVADCPTPVDGEEVEDSKVSQTEAILTKAGVFKIDSAESKDDHPSLLPNLSGSVLSHEDKITLDIHTQLMRELLLLRGSHLKSFNQRKRNILPKEPDLLSILKTAITEHKKAKNGDSESEDSAMEDGWEDGEQITEQ